MKRWMMIIMLLVCQWAVGQDIELANEYLKNGEYEKAKTLFQKLARSKEMAPIIHKSYLQCLQKLKDTDEAEKFIKKQIKSDEANPIYWADYGRLLEKLTKADEADKKYEASIQLAKKDENLANKLAKDFADNDQYELAIKTLNTAREELKRGASFAISLARLYRAMGKTEQMIEEYLQFGQVTGNQELVQSLLQDEVRDEKSIEALEKILYEKVQKFPNEAYYNDMLIWHLVQQKEFYKAFVQARAMDRRYKLEGSKVMELGFLAMQNKDYKAAGNIFEYLVKEYRNSTNYHLFRRTLINAKEEVIKSTYPVNLQDIRLLINEYQRFFDELGKNQRTLEALKNQAHLYAFYLNEKDTATVILEQAIKLGGNDQNFIDRCKLELGDVYLLKNEPWEATLIYSQVEKTSKDSPLGYEAKLKNAKLNYYKGDFELAKEVLDVLKIATTREIANDALSLSLLIQDNIGLDSTETAMKEYSNVELMLYQNKTQEAIVKLDELYKKYKDHPLSDEILWLRANTLLKQDDYQKAAEDLEKIIKEHPYDILCDDARFTLAKIYEEKIKDKETAMRMYREILQKFPGSIYGAEARKRFRLLRGDTIN
ncbi:MAG: tetratricopeptide repeat protein [Spirosomataceae bacterium]